MILEDQKYRAEIFKILGVGLMTPIGRAVLRILDQGVQTFDIQFLLSLLISLLFFLGGIMIQIGYESVQE